MEYLYDGSFEGLLTCIYHHYYKQPAAGIYEQDFYQPSLMTDYSIVSTDSEQAARVCEAIENKISSDSLDMVYRTYLSSSPNKENLILHYVLLGFRVGPKIDAYLTHPDVLPLHKVSRQVGIEVHRFLGLLRFADTGHFLYAAMSPDHHILPLIADHFADRLSSERWIIHDQKRKLAVVYNGQDADLENRPCYREWYLTDFTNQIASSLPEKEQFYQQLWQSYFQQIGIESRYNPRLQSHFVPHRYRRHLVEFQPSSGKK